MTSGRRVLALVVAGVAVGLMAASAFGALTWGGAIAVPGAATLNTNGYASVTSISCADAKTCAVGGYYTDAAFRYEAFVANEASGTWGSAIEVPGTASLNFGDAQVTAISCPSAGNCAAGGYYTDNAGDMQAFVANQVSGKWGNAIRLPGTQTLNHGNALVTAISCASAGNCAAGGTYYDGFGYRQVFVANEKNGVWIEAHAVAGISLLNTAHQADLESISCGGPGNCTVGGNYATISGFEAWVASSKAGVWGSANTVPGTAALNVGHGAAVNSVSCPAAKACTAGGIYSDGTNVQSFLTTGKINLAGKWVWSKAIKVPGTAAALGVPGFAELVSLSCRSAGSCLAGGQFSSPSGNQAFVVSKNSGVWQKAQVLPGVSSLSGGASNVAGVSCASPGTCAVTGWLNASSGTYVASEVSGVWTNAAAVTASPGIPTFHWAGDDGDRLREGNHCLCSRRVISRRRLEPPSVCAEQPLGPPPGRSRPRPPRRS